MFGTKPLRFPVIAPAPLVQIPMQLSQEILFVWNSLQISSNQDSISPIAYTFLDLAIWQAVK